MKFKIVIFVLMSFLLIGCDLFSKEVSTTSGLATSQSIEEITTENITTTAIDFHIENLHSSMTEVTFNVVSNQSYEKELTAKLIFNNNVIQEKRISLGTVTFTGLNPNTNYSVKIGYLSDQQFIELTSEGFATTEIIGPYFKTYTVNKNQINFEFSVANPGGTLYQLVVDIENKSDGGGTIIIPSNFIFQSGKVYNWSYDELKPLTKYCLTAKANTVSNPTFKVYDQHCFTTSMYPYPFEVSINRVMKENAIDVTFEASELDYPKEYIKEYHVKAVNRETNQVESQVEFTQLTETQTIPNLKPGVTYLIELEAVYQIDGVTTVMKLFSINGRCLPSPITINRVYTQSTRVKYGEEFRINVELDNPTNIELTSVTINGIDYSLNSSSYISVPLINLSHEPVTYTVERIKGWYFGEDIEYDFTENNSVEVDTLGEFDLYSIELNNASSVVLPTDELVYQFNITNNTGYPVKGVTIGTDVYEGTSILANESQILVTANKSNPLSNQTISILLDDGLNGLAYTYYGKYNTLFCSANDTEVKTISTPSDLLGIVSGNYKLANDIDMTGVNFTPISSFTGCINGNGYTIKNLTIDTTNTTLNYASMFNVFNGVIENINFDNATIHSKGYSAIVANSNYGLIRNVHVQGELNATGDSIYMGGIVVENKTGAYILNSQAEIIAKPVTNKPYRLHIGGIAANVNSNLSHYSIDHSQANLNVLPYNGAFQTGSFTYIGGISGYIEEGKLSRNQATLNFNVNHYSLTASISIGGVVGAAYNGEIVNCTSEGTLNVTKYYYTDVKPIYGKSIYKVKERDNTSTLIINWENYNGSN